MTTLTKLLDRHARPAQILLKRAHRIALTSAQRTALPDHLDAEGDHLHHTIAGHRAIEVGDVLLDSRGQFWIVDAAPEALLRVEGDASALLRSAWSLGARHVRLAVDHGGLVVAFEPHLRDELEKAGLVVKNFEGPFVPELEAIEAPVGHVHGPDCGHDHHHGHDHHDHGHDHGHDPGHSHSHD